MLLVNPPPPPPLWKLQIYLPSPPPVLINRCNRSLPPGLHSRLHFPPAPEACGQQTERFSCPDNIPVSHLSSVFRLRGCCTVCIHQCSIGYWVNLVMKCRRTSDCIKTSLISQVLPWSSRGFRDGAKEEWDKRWGRGGVGAFTIPHYSSHFRSSPGPRCLARRLK